MSQTKKTELKLENRRRSISDEVLERAKTLYMDYNNIAEIARILDVKRTTIQWYVNEYWRTERNMAASDFIADVAKSRTNELSKIQRNSIAVIRRCLNAIANRAEPPSTKEALDATKILESMDKLAQTNPSDYGYKPEDDAVELDVIDPFAIKEEKDDK